MDLAQRPSWHGSTTTIGPCFFSQMSLISSLNKLLHAIVSPDVAKLIVSQLKSLPRPASCRLTSKSTSRESAIASLSQDLNIESQAIQSVPWFSSAFGLSLDRRDISSEIKNLKAVKQGQIYFQSLSSMLPALCLDVQPGMKILDLCAAPGSKTTLISSLMKGKGSLVAVEKDWVRMQRLMHNVKITTPGYLNENLPTPSIHNDQPTLIGNVALFHSDGRFFKMPKEEDQGQFDRVLVDAPCSGSGRASLYQQPDDSPTPVDWTPDVIQRHVMRQRALLLNACHHLKKGGVLIYSSCSLSIEENESMIHWLLDNRRDLTLAHLTLDRSFVVNRGAQGQAPEEEPQGAVRRVVNSSPMKLRDALFFTPSHQLQQPGLSHLPTPPHWAVTSGVPRPRQQRHKESSANEKMTRLMPCSHFEGFFMAKIVKKR